MSDLSIQFHALPDEIGTLLSRFVSDKEIHVVEMRFPPFSSVEISRDDIKTAIADETVREFALTLSPPRLGVDGTDDFLALNPGALFIEIGRRTTQGLRESWITARTDDVEMLAKWRAFAGQVRKATKAGAIAKNPLTGATARLMQHRHSLGARELESQGVPMLASAGTSTLSFR